MSTRRTLTKKDKYVQGFVRVEDPIEIRRLLERAIDTRAKVDVQLVESSERFSSLISESSDASIRIDILAPKELKAGVMERPTGGCKIIAFLRGQTLLCIQSEKAEWSKGLLKASSPWVVFKLQRRKEARYEIPAAYEMLVKLDVSEERRSIERRMIDLSPSGMAFQVVSRQESELFVKGLFLRKLSFTIEHREIQLDARVSSCIPITGDPRRTGYKIGVEFLRVSPEDTQFITTYVARNLAQLYT